MDTLVDQVAEVIYDGASQFVPWDKATEEDKNYYTSVAEVVVDTICTFLTEKDREFGGLSAAVNYIGLATEAARLRRLAAAQ